MSRALLAFFVLATVSFAVGLHLSEFAVLRDSQALINQGRYLFPLISLGRARGCRGTDCDSGAGAAAALGAGVGLLSSLSLLSPRSHGARFYA